MIKTVEATGRTTDDAVAAALRELREFKPDITAVDVEVELLESARSGFLGIGRTDAKVRVTYELDPLDSAKNFLSGLLEHIGVNGVVDGEMTEEGVIALNVSGENMGVVIGRRGDTLDALQYITSIVVNRSEKEHIRVTVDTENYRKKREESLEALAHKVAGRVLKYKKNVTLEPMNANERRVIHSTLQGTKGITTYSMGNEPNRRVVVALAGGTRSGGKGRGRGGERGERSERAERPERAERQERAERPARQEQNTAQQPPKAAAIPSVEMEWK